MIGEFVAAQHPAYGPVLIVTIFPSNFEGGVVSTAVVADSGGSLHVVGAEDLSIDWHYDSADGKWKPDFEEG